MNRFKLLLLLILGLSTFGCSDLQEEPIGILVPETFFTDVASVESARNGIYARMHHRFFLARETSIQIMLRSDMVDIGNLGTRQERIDHNNFNDIADNGNTLVSWGAMWDIVSACNLTIFGASIASGDEDELNLLSGQAHFIRAMTYYHIVRQFGPVIYIDEPVSDVAALSSAFPNSVEEIYSEIISDLEFAKSVLPNTVSNKSVPSRAAASAYLASVYLTTGDYANALAEAEEVIGRSIDDGDGTYALGLEPDFQNLFHYANVKNSLEPIFVLDYVGIVGINATNWYTDYLAPLTGIEGNFNGKQGGWTVMVPSFDVYDTWDGRDYRRAVSFDTTGTNQAGEIVDYTQFSTLDPLNSNRPHIAKYQRFAGESDNIGAESRASELDYLLMRYAEVLLIAAEAAVEMGDNNKAQTYLNRVRARARNGAVDGDNVKYPPSSFPADHFGSVTVEDVLEERRLELAFEGKRWYDIIRRDLGQSVFSAAGLEGEKPGFVYPTDYLIPIPADEVLRNPNLSGG
ncbi:MAG: RagB/SusD family nutrient uptake outer membrane protein [Cytophagales bacterium]|nr:RagB/SusD family nutrient uptake outer membrane protein [Cytophagales bacterium]